MLTVVETLEFAEWISGLRDATARNRIVARIQRIRLTGAFGDAKSVGEGVSELRFDFGPGYRIYFCRRRDEVVILLGGGDKGSQARDIRAAQRLAKEV